MLLTLLAGLPAASPAWAQPQIQSLASGFEYWSAPVSPRAQQGDQRAVFYLRCDPAKTRFRLLLASDLQGAPQLARASEIAGRFGDLAVLNALYFDADSRLLGRTERLGHVLVPGVATGSAFTGFFYWDGRRAGLKARGEPLPKGAPLLFQSGPRLVWDGAKVGGLETERRARRSAVAVDTEGRVVLAICDGGTAFTLDEFAALLQRPVASGGAGAQRALNLDGGRSTQLYLNRAPGHGGPVSSPGWVGVPAFLGLEPLP